MSWAIDAVAGKSLRVLHSCRNQKRFYHAGLSGILYYVCPNCLESINLKGKAYMKKCEVTLSCTGCRKKIVETWSTRGDPGTSKLGQKHNCDEEKAFSLNNFGYFLISGRPKVIS